MQSGGVVERVGHITEVCADEAADAVAIESALVAVREASAWLDARHAQLVSKLALASSFPESVIAAAAKSSIAAASRSCERAATLAVTPGLARALGDGAITSAHIDVVTRGSKQLPLAQRTGLFDRVESLVAVAEAATVDEFAKRVGLEVRRLQAEDGIDRLERQRRETRVSSWVDNDGMWNLRGRFDPLTGVRLDAKLRATVETLFAEAPPAGCPVDPLEKQKFLAAHALAALLDGAGGRGRAGRPEFVVVVDADADRSIHGAGPVALWPIPVEIAPQVLAELAGHSDLHTVVVCNGIVLHAPGELNLGRSTRLANRAQRRALRGLYATCGIPGCTVGFDRCELHHIIWWRHGGSTDLENLIPVCSRHHGRIHNDSWVIELGPNRQLTLRLPDGSTQTTGPPTIRAA